MPQMPARAFCMLATCRLFCAVRRALSVVLLVHIMGCCIAFGASAADPIFPPGSRIGLVPPAGMVASPTFQGFEDPARNATVVVTELTAQTYPQLEQEFAIDALKRDGFDVESREEVDARMGRGFVVAARQAAARVPMRKWAQVVVADDVTAVVIVMVPESAKNAYPDAAIRAALQSFTLRPKLSTAELLAVLPYTLSDLAGFRPLSATPEGTLVLTYGPTDTSLPVEQPFFMVARRSGEIPRLPEQDRFARQVLTQFVGLGDFRITHPSR